ncbi:MAG: elongation factor P [SAR202 cluster bacterium]|nr:elongation factor P [SAR202 cluster bacterium]
MTIGFGDLKKGLSIEMDGDPFVIVDFERQKMQQRAPVTRIRFRNLRTGKVLDKTYSGFDVKLSPAQIERRKASYIYEDGGIHYFMDSGTFEQFPLNEDQISDALPYMKEQTEVDVVLFGGDPINIELPITVDLRVEETEPGFKGDTATGGNKPARMETGLMVPVPLFVNTGDTIRIDTRTNTYLARL